VRPVKQGIDAIQTDPNPRSPAFRYIRANCLEQRFDFDPRNIGPDRVGEYAFQCFPVLTLHVR